ncbi:nitrous oxide-stimulated promoter family protein [Candidatus Saganbacteria bacterium]|nr:nitrous oxide-stimulated promoter family protein [Candidatus Saganbacteria bacterium]
MNLIVEKLAKPKERELKTLVLFVETFCSQKHAERAQNSQKLCDECDKLLKYGRAKLILCKYDPKPKCRECKTHCYAPSYREKIKEVMKFSGMFLVKRGRLDLLLHFI